MPPDPEAIVLRGGFIWDHETRTFRHGLDVVCTHGRIEAMLPAGQERVARVVDCRSRYVLPGLIDCHVHLTASGEAADLNVAAREPRAVRAWKAGKFALQTLHAGFTTVRDLGAHEHLNIELADAIDSGLIDGPRILAAGMGVTMTGGHGHGFIAREADGPDEVRKAVREQLRAGAKAIKLFASGGVLTRGVDPRSPSYTEAELTAGVEEGHKAGRIVGAHAQATEGVKNAIRAGVDSIEHGVWLDEEAITMMLNRGTYLVATLTAPDQIARGGTAAGIAEYAVTKSHEVLDDHARSFQAAVAAGVRLAMGTDQGTPLNRPGENAQEMVRMAEHGLSKGAAILAATAWSADLLQLECGRIQPGNFADFAIFARDPLEDLRAILDEANIAGVIKGGRLVRWSPAMN